MKKFKLCKASSLSRAAMAFFLAASYPFGFSFAQSNPPLQVESIEKKALDTSELVTLDFTDADINNVLKIIALKAGTNIVSTPDVIGNISIRLVDVPWEKALDVILKTYGYAYQRQGNIILVTKLENISKIQADEPLRTEVFNLKYLDAQDAQKVLIPMLSPRGRISIFYTKGSKGWQFGSFKIGRETVGGEGLKREGEAGTSQETIAVERNAAGGIIPTKVDLPQSIKSKTLVITDTSSSVDNIREFLAKIDNKPKQVLIEAKIMEVQKDKLKDLGLDWGTGTTGASSASPGEVDVNAKNSMTIAGRSSAATLTPSIFSPSTTISSLSNPYSAGLDVIFKKLTGTEFQLIVHALEDDAATNTLSSPRIMTLDNQEASILVGYHTPILSSTVTAGTSGEGATQTQTLDYYQEIGIRLNVVPQVGDAGYINMLIHPSITSSSSNVSATSISGNWQSTVNYPVIDVREAQTQIMVKNGETVVIGGLLKDVKSKETIGVPFLNKLPFIGKLFQRETNDTGKVDLLIFITARVIDDADYPAEKIAQLQDELWNGKKEQQQEEMQKALRQAARKEKVLNKKKAVNQ
ncbi:MAG: secretin and TonB N-terminal domain-containing protein [Candidatus Omnitrophica bacterium]|jgi:type IV pilus assembly protein PilQ|nr:secretin and TonB N-terminal domain-containing protein [Candidatus Omnitrophota bacterium]